MTERKLPPGIREHRGKYQVRYYLSTGERVSETFDRLTDAKRFKRGVDTDRDRDELIDPRKARTPLGEWAETCFKASDVRPATRARDGSLLRCHILPTFGKTPIGRITRDEVQAWVVALRGSGLAPRTVREAYRILGGFMKEAVLSKMIAESPCQKVKLPRIERAEKCFLSPEEVEDLVEAFEEEYRSLIYSAVYLGPRWEELAGLKRTNLDLLHRQVRIVGVIERAAGTYRYVEDTKTKAGLRTLTIPGFLVEILDHHFEVAPESDWVFPAAEGGFLRYDNFRVRVWGPAVKRARLAPLTFHELRHTAAALMIDQGADPLAVQRRLGHDDIRTTLGLYGHRFPNRETELNDSLERAFRAARAGTNGDQMGTRIIRLQEAAGEDAS
jgi:integrase